MLAHSSVSSCCLQLIVNRKFNDVKPFAPKNFSQPASPACSHHIVKQLITGGCLSQKFVLRRRRRDRFQQLLSVTPPKTPRIVLGSGCMVALSLLWRLPLSTSSARRFPRPFRPAYNCACSLHPSRFCFLSTLTIPQHARAPAVLKQHLSSLLPLMSASPFSSSSAPEQLIWKGRFLKIVSKPHKNHSWEYASRTNANGVVAILPVTADGKVLLLEQFRVCSWTSCLLSPSVIFTHSPPQHPPPHPPPSVQFLRL